MNAPSQTTDTRSASAARPTPSSRQRHPALELMGRYKTIFAAAWAHRAELVGPKRLADEAAFLPAALSLQETPVHPAPRRVAWALMLLFVLAVLWSIFGKVDIVAVAPGRIIVSDRTKLIQPLQASVVRRVLVKDGDRVQAGQVLVELDPTDASADKSSVQEQLATAHSESQRTLALLQALSTGKPPRPVQGTPATQALLQSEWDDISSQMAKLDAEAARRKAEAATVQASIAKLLATLPMAQVREADFKRLVEQGYISGHATQDKTRERVELEQDLATQRARLAEVQATLLESAHAKASLRAETIRLLSDRNAKAQTQYQMLTAELTKANQRERLTQLVAPVDGIVQQLAIHSVGGVVTSAQPLMVVVPEQADVIAEISVANLDIGFVNAGQAAAVKLETFPYTRYGTVSAEVSVVSADAVTDDKRGSFYPAVLKLSQNSMDIDGKRVPISPGMNITAEIKTGHRRIIDFLLSPVQRAGTESLRER